MTYSQHGGIESDLKQPQIDCCEEIDAGKSILANGRTKKTRGLQLSFK